MLDRDARAVASANFLNTVDGLIEKNVRDAQLEHREADALKAGVRALVSLWDAVHVIAENVGQPR